MSILNPIPDSSHVVQAFFCDPLKLGERTRRGEMIVQHLGTAWKASMRSNVRFGTLKNNRFFVRSHQNGDRTGLILNPLEDLSLCVGVGSINLIQDHTGLARNRILDQGQKGNRCHTGIAKFLNVIVGAQQSRRIDLEGFVVQGPRCCQGKRCLSDSRGPVQQHGKTFGWSCKIVRQRALHLVVSKDFIECRWAIGF